MRNTVGKNKRKSNDRRGINEHATTFERVKNGRPWNRIAGTKIIRFREWNGIARGFVLDQGHLESTGID